MANQYGIGFYETSAKNNIGLGEAFEDVIEQTYKSKFLNQFASNPQPPDDRRITIDGKKPNPDGSAQGGHKKKCC